MVSRPPTVQALGQRLVERGLLTREGLERALARQRATGELLGTILIQDALVRPEALLQVFSEQFGIPCESLTPAQVDWRVAAQFPPSILAGHRCFPIRADAETVTVAVADPLDVWAISAVEKVAGLRKVQPVLVLERELDAVCRAYKEQMIRLIGDRLTRDGHAKLE